MSVIYKTNTTEPSNPEVNQGTAIVNLAELKTKTLDRLRVITDMLEEDIDSSTVWNYIQVKLQDNILVDVSTITSAHKDLGKTTAVKLFR